MGWDGRYLTNPFTAQDLKTALGASGNLVDNYFTGDDGYINPYSFKKPVRSNKKGFSSDELMVNSNYGFNTNRILCDNIEDVFFKASTIGSWGELYEHPISSFKYRWDDFNGYDSNAKPPFNYEGVTTSVIGLAIEQTIERNDSSIDISSMAVISDFPGNWQDAIAYRDKETSDTFLVNSGDLSSSTMDVVLEFNKTGNYECVFMATNGTQMMWMDNGYFEIEVKATADVITVGIDNPMWDVARERILFSIIIASQTVGNLSVRNMSVKLRFIENDFEAPMTEGEYEFTPDISDIGANQTITLDYNQLIPDGYRQKDYKVYFKVIINDDPFTAVEEVINNEIAIQSFKSV